VHCRIKRLAQLTIGVYGGRADLHDALREHCPGFVFATEGAERDGCRVALIDDDAADAEPRKAIARIVLGNVPGDGGRGAQRAPARLLLDRNVFLQDPANFLAFAVDLAEAAIHASHLEVECGYLTQIAELMAMTDASEVSERITRTVLNLLGLGRGTLFIHDPRLERYVVSFTNDDAVRDTGEFLPGIPQPLLQRALSSGISFAADAEAGMIVMPLQVEDDLVGVIKVPLGADDVIDADAQANVSRYIGAVASVLGNIYQLTRSQDLAMRDDLTKAFNRRFFESYLDEEIERSRRYGSLFSIIFLDLDELKTVNDFYGHLTGSRTLQEVAKRILAAVRGIDKVVRFGGDEFCIILPQTDQEQAAAVANRVRKAIISTAFRLDPDVEVSITASFGIATYPTHAVTKDDLVRQADQAMYRVKSTTKNAVGIAAVEPATRPAAL
jgi:diguanylate cyclase (GGDEF)-like protein